MIEPLSDPIPANEQLTDELMPIPEWPDDPIEMMNRMLAEQSASLHLMFYDLRDYAARIFPSSPGSARAYIDLALRAQSNCRTALDSIARADRAARRSYPESEPRRSLPEGGE